MSSKEGTIEGIKPEIIDKLEEKKVDDSEAEVFELQNEQLGQWKIEYASVDKKRSEVKMAEKMIVIDPEKFPSPQEARQFAALVISKHVGLLQGLRYEFDFADFKKVGETEAEAFNELMIWRGLNINSNTIKEMELEFSSRSLVDEFKKTIYRMVVSGQYDTTKLEMDGEIKQILDRLPKIQPLGISAIELLAGNTFSIDMRVQFFNNLIVPEIEKLKIIDKEIIASEREEYLPTTKDAEMQEMEEESLEQWIDPFFKASLRREVFDGVDYQTMEIVSTEYEQYKYETPESAWEKAETGEVRKHSFFGRFTPESRSKIALPLSADAVPLIPQGFKGKIIKNAKGTYHVEFEDEYYEKMVMEGMKAELGKEANAGGNEILKQVQDDSVVEPDDSMMEQGDGAVEKEVSSSAKVEQLYSFYFIRDLDENKWIFEEPTEEEKEFDKTILDTMCDEVREFLDEIKDDPSDRFKVAAIVDYVKEVFDYVDLTSGIAEEIKAKLQVAGRNYCAVVENEGKVDCEVANFYASLLIRSLGIGCRLIRGFPPRKTKSGFLAVGGIGHAWLEFYDSQEGRWFMADAQPAAPPDDSKDTSDSNKQSAPGRGTDLNQVSREKISSPEEIMKMQGEADSELGELKLDKDYFKRLRNIIKDQERNDMGLTDPDKEDEVDEKNAEARFLEKNKISMEKWKEIKKFVDEVSSEKIARKETIDKKRDSTIGQQWEEIFKLLEERYKKRIKAKKIKTTMDKAEQLDDINVAGTEVLAGSDNPGGFILHKKGDKEVRLPRGFQFDILTDLTDSMRYGGNRDSNMLANQRKFVMTALYQLRNLNKKIQQKSARLEDTPFIGSHIMAVNGMHQWSELVHPRPVDLKTMAAVYNELSRTTDGGGDMVGALEKYIKTVKADKRLANDLKDGKVIKMLTIISDGNMWCSSCQSESCRIEIHVQVRVKMRAIVRELREMGITVNAIGFTTKAAELVEMFRTDDDPNSVLVSNNVSDMMSKYYGNVHRSVKKKEPRVKEDPNLIPIE